MSSEPEHARKIAERIARRVSGAQSGNQESFESRGGGSNLSAELSSVRASLNELQRKLARIEEKVSGGVTDYSEAGTRSTGNRSERPVPLTHSPWLAGVNAIAGHPSQERFGVEEATVSELVDFFEKEKTCGIEPGGKPCDHCSMCSSRGF
jgi:hypothetical protein